MLGESRLPEEDQGLSFCSPDAAFCYHEEPSAFQFPLNLGLAGGRGSMDLTAPPHPVPLCGGLSGLDSPTPSSSASVVLMPVEHRSLLGSSGLPRCGLRGRPQGLGVG